MYEVPREVADAVLEARGVLFKFEEEILKENKYPRRNVESRRVLGPRRDPKTGEALENYPDGPGVPDGQTPEEVGLIRWFTGLGPEKQKRLRQAAAAQPGFRG